MPVHTRLLLAALVVAAGGTGGSAQGNQDTQQAWAERRCMQWGGSPPPPPPPSPPTPDSSTVVVSADGAPGSEEGTVQSTTADVPACVVSQGANGNVYRLHGLWMCSCWCVTRPSVSSSDLRFRSLLQDRELIPHISSPRSPAVGPLSLQQASSWRGTAAGIRGGSTGTFAFRSSGRWAPSASSRSPLRWCTSS